MAFQLPFKFSGSASNALIDSRARPSKMMEYDQPLVWVTLLLMLFGMVMVYSASISLPDSPKFAAYKNTYFLQRQADLHRRLAAGRPVSPSASKSRPGKRRRPGCSAPPW